MRAVLLRLDTWSVPITWNFAGQPQIIECLDDCFIQDLVIREFPQAIPPAFQISGLVATDSPDPVTWRLRFNASNEELPFFAQRPIGDDSWLALAEDFSCAADPRVVVLRTTADWNSTVIAGQAHRFQMTAYKTATGAGASLFDCPA